MLLTREQTFDLWAPAASPWSPWVKPVLFAYLPDVARAHAEGMAGRAARAEWAPAADGTSVLVVDLPGVRSVQLAEALAHNGYRPIPLFNAVPGPMADPIDRVAQPLVDVYGIASALQAATVRSADTLLALPAEAPPVFLLDANRRLGRAPEPGAFDNRSVSLPTDFPSAALLKSRGVTRALLVIEAEHMLSTAGQPQTDLAHTLLRWQEAGLAIDSCGVDQALELRSPSDPIVVERPRWYRAAWHNALTVLGLRRNPLGGFGGELPIPSGSTGAVG
jgi:hypothetical protein